jgi:uncharacterized integral membrane protein
MARRSSLARRLSWIATLFFGVVLSVFSVANHTPVSIDFWPLPMGVDLPLFAVALGMLALGIMVGALLFWVQMLRWRLRARRLERRLDDMQAASVVATSNGQVRPTAVVTVTPVDAGTLPVL